MDEPVKPSWRLFLPGTGGGLFVYLLVCFYFLKPLLLLWDGGTCRHLLTGTYMLTHFRVPSTNYVSALFPDVPCLTHSFFGDLIYGGGYLLWGLNGVVVLCALALALGLTWSFQLGRSRGLGPVSGLLMLVVAMAACSMHWSARPHVFSYLAFLILYYLNFMASLSPARRLTGSAIVMFFWVNLHGSFLIGILLLIFKTVGEAMELAWDRHTAGNPAPAQLLRWDLLTVAAGLAAVCINLRGPAFITYVTNYLSHPMILFHSSEWRSLDFSVGFQVWCFLIEFAVLLALWVLPGCRPRLAEFFVLLFLFIAGLYTMRLIPYFALAVLPAAGPSWRYFAESVKNEDGEPEGRLKQLACKLFALEGRMHLTDERSRKITPALLLITVLMTMVFLVVPGMQIRDFDELRMPVKSVDYIAAHYPDVLGFVYDNWGGYLYWRLHRPVFIDDWTDFYPVEFLQQYTATLMGQAGWQTVLDKYHCDYVLIPHNTLLGAALAESASWHQEYQDASSELYSRSGQGSTSSSAKR